MAKKGKIFLSTFCKIVKYTRKKIITIFEGLSEVELHLPLERIHSMISA